MEATFFRSPLRLWKRKPFSFLVFFFSFQIKAWTLGHVVLFLNTDDLCLVLWVAAGEVGSSNYPGVALLYCMFGAFWVSLRLDGLRSHSSAVFLHSDVHSCSKFRDFGTAPIFDSSFYSAGRSGLMPKFVLQRWSPPYGIRGRLEAAQRQDFPQRKWTYARDLPLLRWWLDAPVRPLCQCSSQSSSAWFSSIGNGSGQILPVLVPSEENSADLTISREI